MQKPHGKANTLSTLNMPNNWKKYKLGDVADIQNGYAFGAKEFSDKGVPIIKIKNITPPYISFDDAQYFNNPIDFKLEKYLINLNDILISMTGSTVNQMSSAVGKIGRYRFNYPALLNQRVGKLYLTRPNLADYNYLYHYISRYDVQYNLALNATGSANQANISPAQIKDIDLELPPLSEQRSIAEILSSLDDKLELNLQTNKTLEEMANVLYKHWFVDFGPFKDGKFVESELGLIPEGWEVKELKDVAEIIMGQSPESKYYNDNMDGLPFHQGVSDYGIRFPSDRIYSTEGNRFAEEGDILFSVRAPVGKINIAKNKIILGRGLAAIRDISNNNNFLFCSIRNQFKTVDSIGSGTVYNSVNKSDMEKINILTPTNKIKQSFNDIIKDLDTQYFNNDSENIILKQTRDYLLPKLISGEIQVKEAAKKVKAIL